MTKSERLIRDLHKKHLNNVAGGIFGPEIIETYIRMSHDKQLDPVLVDRRAYWLKMEDFGKFCKASGEIEAVQDLL